MNLFSLGLDFGTESVRAIIVNIHDGTIAAQAENAYHHGVIDSTLPGQTVRLPADYALQHPSDWLHSAAKACRAAMAAADVLPSQIVGVGVAFTSCTMLPVLADGTPLCLIPDFAKTPLAWPRLWKHHGAKAETDRINFIARQRNEDWLSRYGGVIGLEWFFPKVLEALNHSPHVYAAADLWLEAGDWLVWQLVDGPFPDCNAGRLTRSTCQAGYKALWDATGGYPSPECFRAVDPRLANVVAEKLPGTHRAPGQRAGMLNQTMADRLGLKVGTPVSTAIIDAHAGVPGAGVAVPNTLVMVMGTSSCHMLLSDAEKPVPGVAGIVKDGILPGFFGYETGQASVGDSFAWLVQNFNLTHAEMNRAAEILPPGSGGVLALDWLNGCRTPLMDGRLTGAFIGLTLNTRPAQLYRALMEATAFGVRWIVDTLRQSGVAVDAFVASGGLPAKSPLLMQIYADVLGADIQIARSEHSVALGAAILGALAAGGDITGYNAIEPAIIAMAPQRNALTYKPQPAASSEYELIYKIHQNLAVSDSKLTSAMYQLRSLVK